MTMTLTANIFSKVRLRQAIRLMMATAAALIFLPFSFSLAQAAPPNPVAPLPLFAFPKDLTLCGEGVPLERQEVWEMMDQAFIISVYNYDQVVLWIKRAERYFPYLEKRLKEKGMPDDLKYVAVAESALKTYIQSPAKAVGPWQFVEDTAKRYGLRVDKWFDERRNFEKSTEAALTYLADLHKRFNNWGLAIAAYNCGENRVSKNIQTQGIQNYYDLDLPLETELYVFRILSAKLILSNPDLYGYNIPRDLRYPPAEVDRMGIEIAKELPISIIAKACDTTFKVIREMNPEIRLESIPPGRLSLNVPRGRAGKCSANLLHLLSQKVTEPSK